MADREDSDRYGIRHDKTIDRTNRIGWKDMKDRTDMTELKNV